MEILKSREFSKHPTKGWSGRSKGGMESNKERHSHQKCEKEKGKTIKGAVGKELGEIGKLGLYAVAIPLDFPSSVAVSQGRSQSGGVEAWHFGTIVTIATPMEFQNKSFELQSSV